MNHIGDVIARVVASSAVDRASMPDRVKPKTNTSMQLVFAASPQNTQHKGERAKTRWLGIMIMHQSGMTCLHAACCLQCSSTMDFQLRVLV